MAVTHPRRDGCPGIIFFRSPDLPDHLHHVPRDPLLGVVRSKSNVESGALLAHVAFVTADTEGA
jgi:hypothetical protein